MQPLIIAVLLIKILLSFFSTTLVFTWFKVTNAFKRQNLWTDLFWKSSKFNFSYKAFLAKHNFVHSYSQAMILIPSFHSLRKECLGLQPPFFVLNTKKNNGLQIISLTAYSSKTNKPLLLNKPHVSIKPSFLLKCVWKKKAPPPTPQGRLNRGFTVCLCQGLQH